MDSLENLDTEQTIIVFDLETTGLISNGVMPHITQWSAVELTSREAFNHFIMPKVAIGAKASEMTGISIKQTLNGPIMTLHDQVQEALSLREAIQEFFEWLDCNQYADVVLVAHNGDKFDFPILIEAMKKVGCFQSFQQRVSWMLDSLPLMREKYPNLSSHSLPRLVRDILGESFNAHHALDDAAALAKLLLKSGLDDDDIDNLALCPSHFD